MMATALDHPCPSLLAFAHYVAGEVRLDADPAGARPLLEQSLVEAGKVHNRFVLGIAGVSAIAAQPARAIPTPRSPATPT